MVREEHDDGKRNQERFGVDHRNCFFGKTKAEAVMKEQEEESGNLGDAQRAAVGAVLVPVHHENDSNDKREQPRENTVGNEKPEEVQSRCGVTHEAIIGRIVAQVGCRREADQREEERAGINECDEHSANPPRTSTDRRAALRRCATEQSSQRKRRSRRKQLDVARTTDSTFASEETLLV